MKVNIQGFNCDICKKDYFEEKDLNTKYYLNMDTSNNYNKDFLCDYADVCRKCAERIYDTVREIEMEHESNL